jgi:hypothetical protein
MSADDVTELPASSRKLSFGASAGRSAFDPHHHHQVRQPVPGPAAQPSDLPITEARTNCDGCAKVDKTLTNGRSLSSPGAENLRLLRKLDQLYLKRPFFGSRKVAVQLGVNRSREAEGADACGRRRAVPGVTAQCCSL